MGGGGIDYHGQKVAEEVYLWILVVGSTIAFFAGWHSDDYAVMFRVWAATACVAGGSFSMYERILILFRSCPLSFSQCFSLVFLCFS